MAQFGELFRKIGEDGVSSSASRMTQGIFVGHRVRKRAVLCITKNGVLRAQSWTRQTLGDAWDATNWDGSCGTPWQMVAPELKLTKKVTADSEGPDHHCQGLSLKEHQKLNPRRFYVFSADEEAHGHTGGCPGCVALASHGKATKPHDDESRERIRTIVERTFTGKARMNAYKDRIAETERVKERKRARVERGAGDVPVEPGNRGDEQITVRHSGASGGDIAGNQHEEKRMRDIHGGQRGPEAAGVEQPDKLRKKARFEQEGSSSVQHRLPTQLLLWNILRGMRHKVGPVSVLVLTSGHVDDDVQISALDAFYEKDGRRSRYIGEGT